MRFKIHFSLLLSCRSFLLSLLATPLGHSCIWLVWVSCTTVKGPILARCKLHLHRVQSHPNVKGESCQVSSTHSATSRMCM